MISRVCRYRIFDTIVGKRHVARLPNELQRGIDLLGSDHVIHVNDSAIQVSICHAAEKVAAFDTVPLAPRTKVHHSRAVDTAWACCVEGLGEGVYVFSVRAGAGGAARPSQPATRPQL